MKTFIFDIPNRLRNYSESLDITTILCGVPWEVFTDDGSTQELIFRNDGSVMVSNNGNVYKAEWEYVSANKSIVISAEGKNTMLHPAFIDEGVLAFQKKGTNECMFLIDGNNTQVFPKRTIQELQFFFQEKERKLIEEELIAKQRLLYREEERARQEQKDKQRAQELEQENRRCMDLRDEFMWQIRLVRFVLWSVVLCSSVVVLLLTNVIHMFFVFSLLLVLGWAFVFGSIHTYPRWQRLLINWMLKRKGRLAEVIGERTNTIFE